MIIVLLFIFIAMVSVSSRLSAVSYQLSAKKSWTD